MFNQLAANPNNSPIKARGEVFVICEAVAARFPAMQMHGAGLSRNRDPLLNQKNGRSLERKKAYRVSHSPVSKHDGCSGRERCCQHGTSGDGHQSKHHNVQNEEFPHCIPHLFSPYGNKIGRCMCDCCCRIALPITLDQINELQIAK
jgi:hypothetical protein